MPPPIWVDTSAGFRSMLSRLLGEPALALDTESNSLYVYHEQVCLIQISAPGTDFLVDPLAIDDLSDLAPILADPTVLKILHGADYDLSVLHRDFGFVLSNLFDTMWASRILGWPAHGLAAILSEHFGATLNKKFQRSNWGVRPLPPSQLDYARLDTHYLLPLYQIQARELDAKERWPQARHRFNRLTETRWEPTGFDPDGFWRLTGARDLDDVGRGVLRQLYLFRDDRARRENRPPFRVLTNRTLLVLSESRPRDLSSLQHIKGISKRLARRYGSSLLSAIRRGMKRPLSWEQRPRGNHRSSKEANGRHTQACRTRFEALRAWRNEAAKAKGVEPDVILTNRTLWAVACRNPRCHGDLKDVGLLARWQVDEFGADLLGVVQNTH